MASPLIKVESVDKIYRIWSKPRARLTGALAEQVARSRGLPNILRRPAKAYWGSVCKEFFALKNVSFEVGRGETVGIIGKNGSGKSTTLKIIAGTLQPTKGTAEVNGRVAAMLELAAGFEQDFTGRENVFLSAAILGLTRDEIQDRFDDIVQFADIGDFLDQPVKTYSSGMLVRLAFAVHTAVEPEILIIDEALSVGDETFRRKCFARLDRLREEGTTLLFVSHDLSSVVNLTERALFFHEGEIIMEGKPSDVVTEYQRYCHVSREESKKLVESLKKGVSSGEAGILEPSAIEQDESNEPDESLLESGASYDPRFVSQSRVEYAPDGGEIIDFRLYDENGANANLLTSRKKYTFEYTIRFTEDCRDVTFAMLIKTMKGQELGGSRTLPWDQFIEEVKKGQEYKVRFSFQTLLVPGVYFLNAGVEGVIEGKRAYVHRIVDAIPFRILPEKELMPTGTVDFLVEPEMELVENAST